MDQEVATMVVAMVDHVNDPTTGSLTTSTTSNTALIDGIRRMLLDRYVDMDSAIPDDAKLNSPW